MEKEIQEYLLNTTSGLNGQLRGAINKKAREVNQELIAITLESIFTRAYELGKNVKKQEEALDKLKTDLGITSKINGKRKGKGKKSSV